MSKLKEAESLQADRRVRADRIFQDIYLNGESVEDHDGWESFSGSGAGPVQFNTWSKTVYLRGADVLADTTAAKFRIVFRAKSCVPLTAYLDDKELSLP
jgi:hypothetical protein